MENKCRLVIFLLFIFMIAASGHHFKGLPHFSYFENYPQIPQEEFLGQQGNYEFSLVLYDFQGLDRKYIDQPDDARLFLIVFNLLQNKVYKGPVTLEILDGNKPIVIVKNIRPEEENVYNIHSTLPPTGKYSLRVTLVEENNLQTVIPFLLTSQKVHWGKWIFLGLFLLITIAAIGSRRARILKDRKREKKYQSQQ